MAAMELMPGQAVCTFRFEKDLIRHFVNRLDTSSPWGEIGLETEFDYRSGRADVIGLDRAGRVIAFEAKLDKWRDALHQAYRNTCFAHISYVLLPPEVAYRALERANDFIARKVGICSVGSEVEILLEPPQVEPLQQWLSARAALSIQEAVRQSER